MAETVDVVVVVTVSEAVIVTRFVLNSVTTSVVAGTVVVAVGVSVTVLDACTLRVVVGLTAD